MFSWRIPAAVLVVFSLAMPSGSVWAVVPSVRPGSHQGVCARLLEYLWLVGHSQQCSWLTLSGSTLNRASGTIRVPGSNVD